ncbi:MAG: ABC transporter substrate-binding protein [Longimicrobiales bacterium]
MRLQCAVAFVLLAGAGGALGACDTRARDAGNAVADTLRVRDHADRMVQLAAPAQRVVCLMPAVTDMLLAIGAQDRLIARTQWDTDARIAHLPSTGNALMPSVEWVAAQNPDLVIAWPDQPTRSVVGRLSAMGIPVYNAITETIEDAVRTARDLGVLLAMQSAADSVVRSIEADLQAIRTSVQSNARVPVAYVLSLDPPMIAGPGTFIGQLIDVAGGENVFSDLRVNWPQVSLEELVRRDPQAIVIAQEQGGDNARDRMRTLPGWRELGAVRNGRVLVADVSLFNRAGPNLPLAARALARFLHPGARP